MDLKIIQGILIPFLGTSLGAACVLFMKKDLNIKIQKILTGFAAGVMMAASIWSLIIPSIEQSENMGKFAFLPAFIGFWLGILFLLLLDETIPHLHVSSNETEGPKVKIKRTTMLVLAVTLHNIPEGMAVGVVFAGVLSVTDSEVKNFLIAHISCCIFSLTESSHFLLRWIRFSENRSVHAFVRAGIRGC